jgi:hypothetical protein
MSQACPVCSKSLADGGGLVFKKDELIHARCWADRPEPSASPPPTPPAKPPARKDAA